MNTDRPRLFSYLTKTRFLHIEDSLEHRRLRFFMGSFQKGNGASATAYAFLDVDSARVLLSDMAWGKGIDFADYRGGKDSSGALIARVLKIKSADQKVWIQVQNGVGEELPGGAIRPVGKPFAEISIPLPVFDGRKLAHASLAYLQAWDILRAYQGAAHDQRRSQAER